MEKKVTAIGEILFDIYPGYKKLGGAPFNFLYHVWKLNGQGNFVSRIGNDDEGKEILDILKQKNFDTTFIQLDTEHKTGAVYVELDDNKVPDFKIVENRAYDFIESTGTLEELVEEKTGLLYIGTLAQRNDVSRNTIQNLLTNNVKCFYDINIRQNFYSTEILEKSLSASNVVKLNRDELKLINDLLIKSDFDTVQSAQKIRDKFNLDILCVTLGGEGAYLFSADSRSQYSAKVDDIVDTVGAGDAYAAMLCTGYLKGFNLDRINKLASEFAAEICRIEGAIPGDDNFYTNFREKIENG